MADFTPNYNLYLPNEKDNDVEVAPSLSDNFNKIDQDLFGLDQLALKKNEQDSYILGDRSFMREVGGSLWITNNAYYNPTTQQWARVNTSENAQAIVFNAANDIISFYKAAPGTNPIADWVVGEFESTQGAQDKADQAEEAAKMYTDEQLESRQLTWENVSDKPTEFPPAPHHHQMNDVEGLSGALAQVELNAIEYADDINVASLVAAFKKPEIDLSGTVLDSSSVDEFVIEAINEGLTSFLLADGRAAFGGMSAYFVIAYSGELHYQEGSSIITSSNPIRLFGRMADGITPVVLEDEYIRRQGGAGNRNINFMNTLDSKSAHETSTQRYLDDLSSAIEGLNEVDEKPIVRLGMSTSSVSFAGVDVVLPYHTVQMDTMGSFIDNQFVAPSSGMYLVDAGLFLQQGNGVRNLVLEVNEQKAQIIDAKVDDKYLKGTVTVQLNAGDRLRLALTSDEEMVDAPGSSNLYNTYFSVAKL